jgi:hypothetical protein
MDGTASTTALLKEKSLSLLPPTDDHDAFTNNVADMQGLPTEIELGPKLGAGTFGQVYRGRKFSQGTSNESHPHSLVPS